MYEELFFLGDGVGVGKASVGKCGRVWEIYSCENMVLGYGVGVRRASVGAVNSAVICPSPGIT